MSWIGKMFGIITPKNEIEKYLDECAEYANSLEGRNKSNEFWKLIKQTHEYIENNKFDSNKKDNLGEPPISEEYANQKILEYFEKTPKEKVLEDWNACQLHILFSGKSFAGLDKRKVGEEINNAKVRIPRTECLQPTQKQNGGSGIFVWFDEKGIKHSFDVNKELVDLGIAHKPERVPFEHFKDKKKMKKEVRHCERYILTSLKEDGKVSITIEPKKGFGLCKVGLDITTGEIQKERVLPKYLMNPKPELQAQCDTLAKLIATRDYYNAGHVFNHRDRVYCICSGDVISVDRYECELSKLFFKDVETAQLFQKNFRTEIKSVKHLI